MSADKNWDNLFHDPLEIENCCKDYTPGYLVPRITMPSREDEEIFLGSVAAKRPIKVIALEGAHGAGKSTMCDLMECMGFHTIHEDFMDVFSNFILPGEDNHNCLVEMAWASMQIINLVNMANNIRREIVMNPTALDTFVLDRCYLTGYVYGKMTEETRKWYLELFTRAIEDLKAHYNIEFVVVRMKPKDTQKHFENILYRMDNDSSGVRAVLHEGQRSHLDEINAGYDKLEADGIIKKVFEFDFKTEGNKDVVIDAGTFFQVAGVDMMAEKYKDFDIIFNPVNGYIVGLHSK